MKYKNIIIKLSCVIFVIILVICVYIEEKGLTNCNMIRNSQKDSIEILKKKLNDCTKYKNYK
jgi:hypothetical protein